MPQTQPLPGLSPLTRSDLFSRLMIAEPVSPRVRPIRAFECGTCSSLHDEESDAESCCPPIEVEAYACAICSRVWRYQSGADGCCEGKPMPVRTRKHNPIPDARTAECPVCGEEFGTSDGSWHDAAAHCLGRDLSPAQTHEIAQMVRLRDVPWIEAIEAVAGQSRNVGGNRLAPTQEQR